MTSRSSLSVSASGIVATIVSVCVAVFLVPGMREPTIVGSQLVGSAGQQGQREFRTGLPKHVPLKIKAKNVNNEKWTEDLEIEVANKSEKPIYFLSFSLIMQGFKASDGREFGFWLHYGRAKLIDFSESLQSSDVPLMPNESCVLRIPDADAEGWESFRKKNGKPHPSKIGLVFQSLNFGDGTGFSDAQGTFIDIRRQVDVNEKTSFWQ
ncbi:MAG TPA: hypothetical protein VLA93_01990 [Pyrinomonadaceae bacterium]|nr:hypothetical protein [Pyrinomonadaceae bacterium]